METNAVGSSGEDGRMKKVSRHYFGGDSVHSDHCFYVDIVENIEEDYGMFVWPCSIILSEYIWQQRSRFQGVSVLELGAGTSLPGIVAAKVGSHVTLTDKLHNPQVLNNMRSICDLNKVNCNGYVKISYLESISDILRFYRILGLTWGEWEEPVFNLHPKIILGADVLYDTTGFDDLFATVTFLLKNSPSTVFVTTYHNRSGHHLIEMLMVKWGLKCAKIMDGFSFLPPQKASVLHGNNIQLVEITLDE